MIDRFKGKTVLITRVHGGSQLSFDKAASRSSLATGEAHETRTHSIFDACMHLSRLQFKEMMRQFLPNAFSPFDPMLSLAGRMQKRWYLLRL